MPEDNDIRGRYRRARQEHQWYRKRLLDMVENDDQGTDVWDEYWQEMKRTGKEVMRLSRYVDTDTDRPD